MYALIRAVEYIVDAEIPGDIVECGVWKGGSMLVIARALLDVGDTSRRLHLFDTFQGMPQPSEADRTHQGEPARDILARESRETSLVWALATLDGVKHLMEASGYPGEIVFVPGKVEDTIPARAPDQIALLRLDTDWYESTRHELVHLYPRLSQGGVLIVDDYGHWQGARLATDQYISEHKCRILLNRIDYTGRIAVKLEGSSNDGH
jgi:hypothetical protein